MDAKQQFKSDVRAILDEELVTPVRETALALAQAQAQELAALRALLDGAPELLELAAELARAAGMAQCSRCPARDRCPAFDEPDIEQWPCYKAPAQLRELAQGLRALEEEET